MKTDLVVVWSGAKERAGEAQGLSSPLIGSAARLCMALGSHPVTEGPLKPSYVRKRTMRCQRCRTKFPRVAYERLCGPCFVASNKPMWR